MSWNLPVESSEKLPKQRRQDIRLGQSSLPRVGTYARGRLQLNSLLEVAQVQVP